MIWGLVAMENLGAGRTWAQSSAAQPKRSQKVAPLGLGLGGRERTLCFGDDIVGKKKKIYIPWANLDFFPVGKCLITSLTKTSHTGYHPW